MKWTTSQIDFLKKNYPTLSYKELQNALGRNKSAIKNKAQKLGLRKEKKIIWNDEDTGKLIELFPDETAKFIAGKLGKTIGQVRRKARMLGLTKSEAFMNDKEKRGHNVLSKYGKRYRFKKGHTPWSKGKKLGIRGNMTVFQKGHKPLNKKKIGTITVRTDPGNRKYAWIKVSENKWEQLHRFVWKSVYGEIPPATNITFRDGNSLNCNIENLEALGHDDLMQRNSIMNYPEELRQAIWGLTRLTRTLKKKEDEKSTV